MMEDRNRFLSAFREKLKKRGASATVALGRLFHRIDYDDDSLIQIEEFSVLLQQIGIEMSEDELCGLFDTFDRNQCGSISYMEFLRTVRPPLTDEQEGLVYAVFDLVDADRSGEVTVDDLAVRYDASRHPRVISGEWTRVRALREFLDVFDSEFSRDGHVTRAELLDYYSNVAANFDDPQMFNDMIARCWDIDAPGTYKAPRFARGRPHPAAPGAATVTDDLPAALRFLRERMRLRGAASTTALGRLFRRRDDDADRELDADEFGVLLREIGVLTTPAQRMRLFRVFDRDHTGRVSFMEFLRALRPPLSRDQRALVADAFARLDVDGSGVVTVSDLAARYDASEHPLVQRGEASAEGVLAEFLGVFEADPSAARDGRLTLEEFEAYYTTVAANFDSPEGFTQMMRKCWRVAPQSNPFTDRGATSFTRSMTATAPNAQLHVPRLESTINVTDRTYWHDPEAITSAGAVGRDMYETTNRAMHGPMARMAVLHGDATHTKAPISDKIEFVSSGHFGTDPAPSVLSPSRTMQGLRQTSNRVDYPPRGESEALRSLSIATRDMHLTAKSLAPPTLETPDPEALAQTQMQSHSQQVHCDPRLAWPQNARHPDALVVPKDAHTLRTQRGLVKNLPAVPLPHTLPHPLPPGRAPQVAGETLGLTQTVRKRGAPLAEAPAAIDSFATTYGEKHLAEAPRDIDIPLTQTQHTAGYTRNTPVPHGGFRTTYSTTFPARP